MSVAVTCLAMAVAALYVLLKSNKDVARLLIFISFIQVLITFLVGVQAEGVNENLMETAKVFSLNLFPFIISALLNRVVWLLMIFYFVFNYLLVRRILKSSIPLWMLAIFIFSCQIVALFSLNPGFLRSEFAVFMGVILFSTSGLSFDEYCLDIVAYLLIAMLIGVIAWPFVPKYVSIPYDGYLSFRFKGIFGHPNQLGILSVFGLTLMSIMNRYSARFKLFAFVVFMFSLVISQSKTALIALLVVLILHLYRSYRGVIVKIVQSISPWGIVYIVLAFILSYSAFARGLNWVNTISGIFGTSSAALSSFTGRDAIWAITLKTWATNPITGYGPSLWDESFRTAYRMPFAGHAHNQFIHILGEFGVVGLLLLLGLYIGISWVAYARRTNRFRFYLLFALFLVWCISETPMASPPQSINFYIQNALFLLLVGGCSSEVELGD